LNKFSEGSRLSAPRKTRAEPTLRPSIHVALLNARRAEARRAAREGPLWAIHSFEMT
jgi:hypothetical protein